jgi:hypothetical protein
MSEYQDPPLRLQIQGMRWLGDDFKPVGPAASMDLYATDTDEDSTTALRALRRLLVKRLQLSIPLLSVHFADLDFEAPNFPTEIDLDGLVQHAERIVDDLRALRELASEVVPDDDDDGGGEPEPELSPSPPTHDERKSPPDAVR